MIGRLAVLSLSFFVTSANAASLNPEDFTNSANLLLESTLNTVVKTVGLAGEFRPIQAATPPSGVVGLDVGVSGHVTQIPSEFTDALTTAGYKPPKFSSLPVGHVQLQQRLTPFWSLGAGYLKYQGFKLIGATTQFSWIPDEGPAIAFRLTYSKNELGFVTTRTYSPTIVISKQLAFFEPFIGGGLTSTHGSVEVPITVGGITFKAAGDARVTGYSFLGGILVNLYSLQIALQGDYNTKGINGMGAKVSIHL